MIRYLFYAATIIVWGIFIFAFHRDRSRYRNCVILFAALMMSAEGLLLLAGGRIFTMVLVIVFFWASAGADVPDLERSDHDPERRGFHGPPAFAGTGSDRWIR